VASTTSDLLLFGLDAVWDRLEACGQVINLAHDEIDILIPKGSWPDLEAEFQRMGRSWPRLTPVSDARGSGGGTGLGLRA
jgi:hypothetical protein